MKLNSDVRHLEVFVFGNRDEVKSLVGENVDASSVEPLKIELRGDSAFQYINVDAPITKRTLFSVAANAINTSAYLDLIKKKGYFYDFSDSPAFSEVHGVMRNAAYVAEGGGDVIVPESDNYFRVKFTAMFAKKSRGKDDYFLVDSEESIKEATGADLLAAINDKYQKFRLYTLPDGRKVWTDIYVLNEEPEGGYQHMTFKVEAFYPHDKFDESADLEILKDAILNSGNYKGITTQEKRIALYGL